MTKKHEKDAEEFLTKLLGEDKVAEYKGTWCVITDGEMVHASEIEQKMGAKADEHPFIMPNKGSKGTGYNGGAGVIAPKEDCDYTILTCNMDLLQDAKAKMRGFDYKDCLWVPCFNSWVQSDTADGRVAKMKEMSDAYKQRPKVMTFSRSSSIEM